MAIDQVINGYNELVKALRSYVQKNDELMNQFIEVITKHATETKNIELLNLLVNYLTRSQELAKEHSEVMDILGTAMRDSDEGFPPKE